MENSIVATILTKMATQTGPEHLTSPEHLNAVGSQFIQHPLSDIQETLLSHGSNSAVAPKTPSTKNT